MDPRRSAASNIVPTSLKKTKPGISAGGETHSVTRRLRDELMALMTAGCKGISAFPDSDNMLSWVGTVTGPPSSVYEGLVYKIEMKFPLSYPYTAPTVRFETPCFHPNVDSHGNICLDILKDKWSAVYNVQTILLSLQSLLGEPNNESPLNQQAANLWKNQEEYKQVLLKTFKESQ